MVEEWKLFEEDPRIEVSNYGNVRNAMSGKLYYLRPDYLGYTTIRLQSNYKSKDYKVHRLVALCFIANTENKPCVNHKDGVKYNNFFKNLEWCTHQENIQHACDAGLISRMGSKNSKAKIDEDVVHAICQWFQDNPKLGAKEASNVFDVSYKTLVKIRCNENWKHIRCLYKIPPLTKRAKFID